MGRNKYEQTRANTGKGAILRHNMDDSPVCFY